MKSQHIFKLYCQYISFQKNLQKIVGKRNGILKISRNILSIKDYTAIHLLVALINKKRSLPESQGQGKKDGKERNLKRLVLSRRIL